jgi:hypothetical protein
LLIVVGCQLCGNCVMHTGFSPQEGVHVFDTVFTDKAWLHVSEYINSRNSRMWSAESPSTLHENTLYSSKSVCSSKSFRKQILRLFFEKTGEETFLASAVITHC